MAAALRTLDVNLTQVLIDFFDDDFNWHHRFLVVAQGGASWICVTPDLQVETVDLSAHRVLPLRRNSPFPQRAHDTMYIFDPISDQDLVELQRGCLSLARVLERHHLLRGGGWRVVPLRHGARRLREEGR